MKQIASESDDDEELPSIAVMSSSKSKYDYTIRIQFAR